MVINLFKHRVLMGKPLGKIRRRPLCYTPPVRPKNRNNTTMKKGTYVEGFVISIPKKNTAKYKTMAREGLKTWMKYGALDYKECIIDVPNPLKGTFTFRKMAKTKPSEATWFSFITYKSKAHRDAVNKKVMAYFAKKYSKGPMAMPFDMKRMAHATFRVEVGA